MLWPKYGSAYSLPYLKKNNRFIKTFEENETKKEKMQINYRKTAIHSDLVVMLKYFASV